MGIPDRSLFESMYAGLPPWDIGRPQRSFVEKAERISGAVLDAGCGTGENALYFAGLGRQVTGIDFLEGPIERARQKAAERSLAATFHVLDALRLHELPDRFDSAIDSGLFHGFADDDRRQYVAALATVIKPGGRIFLMCFSEAEPGDHGPRRVSRPELEAAFAQGWSIESIEPTQFEVRPDFTQMEFSPGGPKSWFAVVQRNP